MEMTSVVVGSKLHHHDPLPLSEEEAEETNGIVAAPSLPYTAVVRGCHAVSILILGFAICILGVSFGLSYFHIVSWSPPTSGNENSDDEIISDFQVGQVDSSTFISMDVALPFSLLDPVDDLGLKPIERPEDSRPPEFLQIKTSQFIPREGNNQTTTRRRSRAALPTNAWYQNMLLKPVAGQQQHPGEPTELQRVYSIPYILDTIGILPGIRIHRTHVVSTSTVMQLAVNSEFALVLGASWDRRRRGRKQRRLSSNEEFLSHQYRVTETNALGFTMEWNAFPMKSSIVRGMPYVTMEYNKVTSSQSGQRQIFPTFASSLQLQDVPIIDQKHKFDCPDDTPSMLVEHELELSFQDSDYTWLVFFSEPVWLGCEYQHADDNEVHIQIVGYKNQTCHDTPLVVRAALVDTCTQGTNPVGCREGLGDRLPEEVSQKNAYAATLRQFSNYIPGPHTAVGYSIQDKEAHLLFDWNVQRMPMECRTLDILSKIPNGGRHDENDSRLITFALPHHLDKLNPFQLPGGTRYCRSSIHGPVCLVEGTSWTIQEKLPQILFQAPRPPRTSFVSALAQALEVDIKYSLPDYFQRGAGDTYFSGKMLAKLGRILLITEELNSLCQGDKGSVESKHEIDQCGNATLPSPDQITRALDRLRSSTEIWINGTGETPFVYDTAWGGVLSCGCLFNGQGCDNHYPDCPAFSDQGLNFGNAIHIFTTDT